MISGRDCTALLQEKVERPILRRLAAETLAVHGKALREHPAAKSMHHAYRGGLLEHVVSMAELAVRVCEHYGDVDRDLVVLGVLFHDLGKLRELGAMPANDYTLEGRLIGHVVIGRDLLRDRCAAIEGFPDDLRAAAGAPGPLPPGQEGVRLAGRADDPGGGGPPLRGRPRFEGQPAPRRRARPRRASSTTAAWAASSTCRRCPRLWRKPRRSLRCPGLTSRVPSRHWDRSRNPSPSSSSSSSRF